MLYVRGGGFLVIFKQKYCTDPFSPQYAPSTIESAMAIPPMVMHKYKGKVVRRESVHPKAGYLAMKFNLGVQVQVGHLYWAKLDSPSTGEARLCYVLMTWHDNVGGKYVFPLHTSI